MTVRKLELYVNIYVLHAACRPRYPIDIIFAIDQRSQSPHHSSHLYRIAFSVMSAMRGDTRIHVRFIPETMDGVHQQPVSGLNGDRPRPVAELVGELAESLRKGSRISTASRKKEERLRRHVGIYVTDGRSSNTGGTVLAVERAIANLPRRTDLISVGIGPEVAETQLITIAGGRLDRLITAYTGAGNQVSGGLQDVTNRLVSIICDGEQR
jgi:hypothetical protein